MKNCVNCGKSLPDEAEFCPFCTAVQSEKIEIKPPRPWKKRAVIIGIIAVIVIAGIIAVARYHAPKTLIGGSSLIYSDGGEDYLLMLCYDRSGINRLPSDETKVFVSVNERLQKPSQFFIYPADGSERDISSVFMDKVASVEVRTEELNGRKCEIGEAHWDEDFPAAALISYLFPDWLAGDNDVIWTFHMKNGDTIELRHRLNVEVTQQREYRSDTYAMSTAAELQALLDEIEATTGEYDTIYIYLPAVTYTESVSFRNRDYRIFGAEGNERTAFAAAVYCYTSLTTINVFYDVDFIGDGKGAAIIGEAYAEVRGCTVRGWETGILAHYNAAAQNSVFEDNGVAILIDTEHFIYSEGEMFDNTFRNNGIAFQLVQLPTEYPFVFDGCTFSGNGEDIVNETVHPIDTDAAIFTKE